MDLRTDYDLGTVKLGFKEWLDKEQLGNSEQYPVTNSLNKY